MIDNGLLVSYNNIMGRIVTFIGHRLINKNYVLPKLKSAIEIEINDGVTDFILGFHGQFDSLVLKILLEKKKIDNKISIDLVFPDLNSANAFMKIYPDTFKLVMPVIYGTELIHYKRRINYSNKSMIDDSDKLICYVDKKVDLSGAKTALVYAEKKGKEIINLY